MKWYIAKIVFRIAVDRTQTRPQFDEQLRLIGAASAEEAFLKARVLGLREEHAGLEEAGKTVKWEFINVSEVAALPDLEDGAEIYSQVHETDEATSYIQWVHQKAIFLRTHGQPCDAA